MEKLEPELKTLSLTGRLCYLFMCIEKYLTLCYPKRKWESVAKRCWQWTNVYWNEGCDIYSVVVPEYLLKIIVDNHYMLLTKDSLMCYYNTSALKKRIREKL